MTSAAALLRQIEDLGGRLVVIGGKLQFRGHQTPSDHLLRELRKHRAELLACLSGPGAPTPSKVPGDVNAGLLFLVTMPPPHAFPPFRWRCFQDDAAAFSTTWGAQAAETSWSLTELYGLSHKAPWGCWRGFGLVPMLNGARVTSIDAGKAEIGTKTGCQTYRRRPPWPDAVPAWELA